MPFDDDGTFRFSDAEFNQLVGGTREHLEGDDRIAGVHRVPSEGERPRWAEGTGPASGENVQNVRKRLLPLLKEKPEDEALSVLQQFEREYRNQLEAVSRQLRRSKGAGSQVDRKRLYTQQETYKQKLHAVKRLRQDFLSNEDVEELPQQADDSKESPQVELMSDPLYILTGKPLELPLPTRDVENIEVDSKEDDALNGEGPPSEDAVLKEDHDLAVKLLQTRGRMDYIDNVLLSKGGSWKDRFNLFEEECERLGIPVPFKDANNMRRSFARYQKRIKENG